MVSKGGKIAISLAIVVTMAVALMAWCVWRKRLVERKQQLASVSQESVKPTCTDKMSSPSSSVDGDDASYKECDYNNLGMHHSQLNVHLCKSSMCEGCTDNDPPSVCFVRSEKKTVKDLEEASAVKEETTTMPDGGDGRMSTLPEDKPLDIAVIPTGIAREL